MRENDFLRTEDKWRLWCGLRPYWDYHTIVEVKHTTYENDSSLNIAKHRSMHLFDDNRLSCVPTPYIHPDTIQQPTQSIALTCKQLSRGFLTQIYLMHPQHPPQQ